MALHYKAVNSAGEVVHGTFPGDGDERALVAFLQNRGLVPLAVTTEPGQIVAQKRPSKKISSSPRNLLQLDLSRKLDPSALISLAADVAVLLDAGISLPRALVILQDLNQGKRKFARILRTVHDDLREGSMFWEALDKHQPQIPKVFTAMTRAGETGGALPIILSRLAVYLEEMQELKDYVRGAMIYPVILTLTSLISLVLMLTLVVPKFAQVFQDMGMELPAMTLVMFRAGEILQSHWWVMLLGLGGLIGLVWLTLRSPQGKLFWDKAVLRIPAIGTFKSKIEIARFCRTLGTLLDCGVPILESMQIVRGVVLNSVLNQVIGQAHDDLKRGEVLSAALAKSGLFPTLTINMIGVGEETGQLGTMLDKVGLLYDKELKKGIKTFSSFFEPMVLLVMGTLIGGMVISMLMAIFSINDMQM